MAPIRDDEAAFDLDELGGSGEPGGHDGRNELVLDGSDGLVFDSLDERVLDERVLDDLDSAGPSGDVRNIHFDGLTLDGLDEVDALDGLDLHGTGSAAIGSSWASSLAAEAARSVTSIDLDDPTTQLLEEIRRRRPWWWSQLDLTIAWRRSLDGTAAKHATRGELWILASWSR